MTLTIQALTTLILFTDRLNRYEDMSYYGLELARIKAAQNKAFNADEKELFFEAFKGYMGELRTTYDDTLTAIRDNERDERDTTVERQYLGDLAQKINRTSDKVIDIMNSNLKLIGSDLKEKVYYLKMIADYNRYKAEVATEADVDRFVGEAEKNYTSALEIASDNLSTVAPIRLAVALNASVFFKEIKGDRSRALAIASEAYHNALLNMEEVTSEKAADVTTIMQLLRSNMEQWNAEAEEEGSAYL